MKKYLLFFVAFATIFIASCSKKTRKNDQRDLVISELQNKLDSAVKINGSLSNRLTIYTEDSTMTKYCQIPDTIKKLWWEYVQAQTVALAEYEKVDVSAKKVRDNTIALAKVVYEKEISVSENAYESIETPALKEFSHKENILELIDSGFIGRCNPYLDSRDDFWSITIEVENYDDTFSKNRKKMPSAMLKFIQVCRPADSLKSSSKSIATAVFEKKKSVAEELYKSTMLPYGNIRDEKIAGAYQLYLQQVKWYEESKK